MVANERIADTRDAYARSLPGGISRGDASGVDYRRFERGDVRTIVREYDGMWGCAGGSVSDEVSLLLSRHCVLHYLSLSTRGYIAQSDGAFLGVLFARLAQDPPIAPEAEESLRDVDSRLRGSVEGRRALEAMDAWFAREPVLERDAGLLGEVHAEIELFLVSGAARGHGVGNGLGARALDYFHSHGENRYYLHTDSSCDVGFYEHKGLSRVAERIDPGRAGGHDDGAMHVDQFVYAGRIGLDDAVDGRLTWA